MKTYLLDRMYKASSGIANAIFVTIGIGLLLETIGNMTGLTILVIIGTAVKMLMAPAIGAGIAVMLGEILLRSLVLWLLEQSVLELFKRPRMA